MFQYRCNELQVSMRLTVQTPLLVDAGDPPAALMPAPAASDLAFPALYAAEQQGIRTRLARASDEREQTRAALVAAEGNTRNPRDKLAPDMIFVRTMRHGQPEPYLPGASLKGALRNHSEQLLRTLLPANSLCDLFDETASCTKRVEGQEPLLRYGLACPSCRLFGCGGLAGRLQLSDAYLARDLAPQWGQRSGVGINRERGVAETSALFFYEVLEHGAFTLTLTLENFELWQLGLLAHTLHALWTQQLPVGYGAQRGLGLLRGDPVQVQLSYFGRDAHVAGDGCLLHGIDSLYPTVDNAAAPFIATSPVPLAMANCTTQGLRHQWRLAADAQTALWAAGAAAFDQWVAAAYTPTPNTQEESTP